MRLTKFAAIAAALIAIAGGTSAQPIIDKPAALPQPVKLTLGFAKVGHLAPIQLLDAELKSMNVILERVEFVRYADARTALASGSLDLATVGPADLPIALSQGVNTIVALMGVGSAPKYIVVRNGVKIDEWKDIVGKKVAIAPGSAVWFQFAATVQELGIPYNQIQTVNVQGGGANIGAALKRGEVDAMVSWEPFESMAVFEGYGYIATKLDYSISKAVGAELGLIAASRSATTEKREALRRFIWAYIKAQNELAGDKAKFAEAVAAFTNVERKVADRIVETIKLGAVLSLDQMKRQTTTFHQLGVIQKDVSADLDKYFEGALVDSVLKK